MHGSYYDYTLNFKSWFPDQTQLEFNGKSTRIQPLQIKGEALNH